MRVLQMVSVYLLIVMIFHHAFAQTATESEFESLSTETGEPCFEDRDAFFELDFWTFDQNPEIGSRSVFNRPGCRLAAADLIRDYHARLQARGEPVTHTAQGHTFTLSKDGHVDLLYWHEGQVRAFIGQTDQAIALFRKSFKPTDRAAKGWNLYARGSIAFLERDYDGLTYWRNQLFELDRRSDINLSALDGLIKCFEKPYAEAYSSADCRGGDGAN